jgi:hypothetical protein
MRTPPTGRHLRAAISAAQLTELYVTQRLTIEQAAAKLGVAPTTVARRFKDLAIQARPRGRPPSAPRAANSENEVQWTAKRAYVVGLITTDGCLSRDGRHLTITSKDLDLLETARQCLGVAARIARMTNPRPCYRLQWSDVLFYRWLIDIGLMPAKSLRLGSLRVPDEWFRDFVRGCIDGDGSILTYTDRYNTTKNSSYIYTRVYVSLVSASPRFIEWFRASLQRLCQIHGDVGVRKSARHHDIWRLRYAKRESLALLRWMYYAPDVTCLQRKREVATPLLVRRARPLVRRPGRPVVV